MTSYPQRPLDLKFKPALGSEDFFISGCNQSAVHYLQSWPTWPQQACLLWGPEASGKTHLAHLWKNLSEAQGLDGTSLNLKDVERQAHKPHPLVIEHIESILQQLHLLQLINIAQESRTPLLMTSRLPPGKLPFDLPDLTSRLKGLISLELLPPDDGLLTMVLLKLCHDQHLTLSTPFIDYLIPRIHRTYSFIQSFVDELRQLSLSAKRQPTIPMAKAALERMGKQGE